MYDFSREAGTSFWEMEGIIFDPQEINDLAPDDYSKLKFSLVL